MTYAARRVLAADVGGTHARLATFELPPDGRPVCVRERTWPSRTLDGLRPILERYVDEADEELVAGCVAVAGPVRSGRATLTNLGWTVETRGLAESTGVTPLRLVNDFVAIGHGVGSLRDDEIEVLREGAARPETPVLVVGPGTGLGVAWIDPVSGVVHASEGGHGALAPWDDRSRALDRHLRRTGHVSWERVVSGPGLAEIYRFFAADAGTERAPPAEAGPRLRDSGDGSHRRELLAPEEVSQRALAGRDACAVESLKLFCRGLAAFVENCVLTLGALGGVFLVGGITRDIRPMLRGGGPFLAALGTRGRMSDYAARLPVRVVLNEAVGLLGAAELAREAWLRGSSD